jgi:hypothetical protein
MLMLIMVISPERLSMNTHRTTQLAHNVFVPLHRGASVLVVYYTKSNLVGTMPGGETEYGIHQRTTYTETLHQHFEKIQLTRRTNMLKNLLLASALLLPLSATPALAYIECHGPDYEECEDDGNINVDDPDLKPDERAILVRIKTTVDKRREDREEREAKAEEARLAKCTVRFLRLGCLEK